MGLLLRRNLSRPLTHDELDGNLIYLDINEWVLQSYEKGMWCYIKGVDDIAAMYLCEITHNKNIYPSGAFAEVVNTVRIWRPFTGGGGNVYFQNPLPSTATNLEGVPAGTTFPVPTDMQDMWDMLLYPYQLPSFSSFTFITHAGTLEVGHSFTGDTASWSTSNSANVVNGSVAISGAELTPVTGLDANGTTPLTFDNPVVRTTIGTKTWTITGTNTHAGSFSRNFSITWGWKYYWGTATGTTLNEAEIEGLANSGLFSDFNGNYSFQTGGYKYICIPDDYCSPTHYPANFWDYSLGLQVAMTDGYANSDNTNSTYYLVSVTNTYGEATLYRVYRTKWQVGLLTIIVT